MKGQDLIGDVENLMSSPIGQMGLSSAKSYLNLDRFSQNSLRSLIFNQEIRAYFNINTKTAIGKVIKLLFPFREGQFDNDVKRMELYVPILSLVTLLLFSTLYEGIIMNKFDPRLMSKLWWIILLTLIEVCLAKCTENTISNMNIELLELTSMLSYRFVPMSAIMLILVIGNGFFGQFVASIVGLCYIMIVDTYYCKVQLEAYCQGHFKQSGGLGNKIALLYHVVSTIIIAWIVKLI